MSEGAREDDHSDSRHRAPAAAAGRRAGQPGRPVARRDCLHQHLGPAAAQRARPRRARRHVPRQLAGHRRQLEDCGQRRGPRRHCAGARGPAARALAGHGHGHGRDGQRALPQPSGALYLRRGQARRHVGRHHRRPDGARRRVRLQGQGKVRCAPLTQDNPAGAGRTSVERHRRLRRHDRPHLRGRRPRRRRRRARRHCGAAEARPGRADRKGRPLREGQRRLRGPRARARERVPARGAVLHEGVDEGGGRHPPRGHKPRGGHCAPRRLVGRVHPEEGHLVAGSARRRLVHCVQGHQAPAGPGVAAGHRAGVARRLDEGERGAQAEQGEAPARLRRGHPARQRAAKGLGGAAGQAGGGGPDEREV